MSCLLHNRLSEIPKGAGNCIWVQKTYGDIFSTHLATYDLVSVVYLDETHFKICFPTEQRVVLKLALVEFMTTVAGHNRTA